MNNNYFVFDDEYYKSVDGTSMGDPLSPFVGDFFMGNFETTLDNHSGNRRKWKIEFP